MKKLFMVICIAVLLSFGLVISGCTSSGTNSDNGTNGNSVTNGKTSSTNANNGANQNESSVASTSSAQTQESQSSASPTIEDTNNNGLGNELFRVKDELLNVSTRPDDGSYLYLNRGGNVYSLNRSIWNDELSDGATYDNLGREKRDYTGFLMEVRLYDVFRGNDVFNHDSILSYGDITPIKVKRDDSIFSRSVHGARPSLRFFPITFAGNTIGFYRAEPPNDNYETYEAIVDTYSDISIKNMSYNDLDTLTALGFTKAVDLKNLTVLDAHENIVSYNNNKTEGLILVNLPKNERYTISWDDDNGHQEMSLVSDWRYYTFDNQPFDINEPLYSVDGVLVPEKESERIIGSSFKDEYFKYDLSNIPSGMYAITFADGNGVSIIEIE